MVLAETEIEFDFSFVFEFGMERNMEIKDIYNHIW